MQCLECIEHKQKGNTKDLEKITSNCLLYQNNQCVHITTQIEPTPKLNFIKPLILLIGKLLFTQTVDKPVFWKYISGTVLSFIYKYVLYSIYKDNLEPYCAPFSAYN